MHWGVKEGFMEEVTMELGFEWYIGLCTAEKEAMIIPKISLKSEKSRDLFRA